MLTTIAIRLGADAGALASIALRSIPGGTFLMGSSHTERGHDPDVEAPTFRCTLDFDWFMGVFPVTQSQLHAAVSGCRFSCAPSLFNTLPDSPERPVDSISWSASCDVVNILNARFSKELPLGYVFSLPTEAMWEYACRGGTSSRYYCGDSDKCLLECGWCAANSGGSSHPVGQKKANPFGLYDMHGNVSEWCLDEFSAYPSDDQVNWRGKEGSGLRVVRGGNWRASPSSGGLRSASRCELDSTAEHPFVGFRVCAAPVDKLTSSIGHAPA
ncbi:MAG: formylglycine-generating enzyme family protein [Planctomycetaceae bacterium]